MFLLLSLLSLLTLTLSAKQKVIYSNDQGYPGCDGDNPQALVHYLFYANDIDTQLIIASGSTNCYHGSRGTNIDEVYSILDLYDKDYNTLNSSSVNNGGNAYPTGDHLRSLSMQGCNSSSPSAGYPPYSLAASDAIIKVVDSLGSDEYVWYGAGAGLCELARALHDKPSIADKIRLYAIGSWNTQQDPYSRDYIFNNFPNLWYVESNYTFGGWFNGGNQSGMYNDVTYDTEVISKGGNLGSYYSTIIPSSFNTPAFQEGDGPSYFYVIDPEHSSRNLADPTLPNWGGQYKQVDSNRDTFWADGPGGDSVNEWRVDYLNDWQKRLQWLN